MKCCHCPVDVLVVDNFHFMRCLPCTCENKKGWVGKFISLISDLLRLHSSCLPLSAWLICQVQPHDFITSVYLAGRIVFAFFSQGFIWNKHTVASHAIKTLLTYQVIRLDFRFLRDWAPLLLTFALNVAKGSLSERYAALIVSLSRLRSHRIFQ